jgi:hypothetical protein
MRLLARLVVLGFAVIQLVLVARILMDLGVIPADLGLSDGIVGWSDTFAAPVAGLGGGLFGGGGVPGVGEGLNPVMIAALAGWTVVEGLVMRVVRKLSTV